MRKFKHPVSMYLTVKDIKESYFIQEMDRIGYKTTNLKSINSKALSDRLFLYTNCGQNDVSFQWHAVYKDKNHIEHSDPNLFIAIASMRVGGYFYKNEVLIKKEGDFTCTFKSFTANPDLFYCFEDSSIRDVKDFRKASREEIINKFKYKPVENKLTPKNGDIVEFSYNGVDYSKGEYIGALRKSGHIIFRLGTITTLESGLIVAPFIREYNEPTKVTRAEIAKLLGVDDFEIID